MAVSPRDAPAPQSRPTDSSGGLDVSTLVITAIASAGAALISSELLGSGTLVSAALTPVVIALIKEALDRPRRVVTTRVPAAVARPRRRRAAGGRDGGDDHAAPRTDAHAAPRADAHTAPGGDEASWAAEVVPGAPGEVHVYRSTRRRWRLAIVTGLLGFLLAAAVLTVTELAAGGAVSGGSRATTYFGGSDAGRDAGGGSDRSQDAPPAGDESPAAPSTTPDPSATTPEAPAAPQDAPQETVPSTPSDPAAPAPPAESAPAPAPETPAPVPQTPAPTPDAPATPAP